MAYANVNGVKIFYELKGDQEGKETIGFFNGVMSTTMSWSFEVPIFEKFDFKILLHDFKGQLMSEKPDGPYTFRQHAEDARALLDYLGIKRLHIIGTSYGGEVGMRFAIDFPEYVKSLSIIDSLSELDGLSKMFVKNWKDLAEKKNPEEFYWGMFPSVYGNQFIENNLDFLKERGEMFKAIPEDFYDGQIILYDTFLNDVYMTDELPSITCPTLVICGENDILKPVKFSRIMAKNIPNCEFVILPDCGHVAIYEKPEELKTLLLGFILKNS